MTNKSALARVQDRWRRNLKWAEDHYDNEGEITVEEQAEYDEWYGADTTETESEHEENVWCVEDGMVAGG
jgi:hypothetical protein